MPTGNRYDGLSDFMHSWHALTDKLPAVTVSTLPITGDLADQRWQPADAEAAARAGLPPARDTLSHPCLTLIKSQVR
jgi:hypothetical protein